MLNRVTLNSSSSCDPGLFTEYVGSQFLPNNLTGPLYPQCPIANPADSNSTDGYRAFFGFGSSIGDQDIDNFTIYDQVITSHLPVFVTMWLKSTSNASTTGELLTPGGWADTQVMCIPANQTQPGSRNFTEAEKTQAGAAGKVTGAGMGMIGVVSLTVLFGLFV